MIKRKMKNMNKTLPNIRRQAGWTFWSLIFTLGVLGFFAYVGMKLVPVYGANGNVQNAIKRSVDGKDLRKITRTQIKNDIEKQLNLDVSEGIINYKTDLKVKRARNTLVVEAIYERKIPLFFNLSVTADFHPKVECDLTGRCK